MPPVEKQMIKRQVTVDVTLTEEEIHEAVMSLGADAQARFLNKLGKEHWFPLHCSYVEEHLDVHGRWACQVIGEYRAGVVDKRSFEEVSDGISTGLIDPENERVARQMLEEKAQVAAMTHEQRWEYLVRKQDEYWATLSAVEHCYDREIDGNDPLTNYTTAEDYFAKQDDD